EECDFESVMAILRVGANGFMLKRIDCEAFTKSLELVMLGQSVLSSSVVELFMEQKLEPQAAPPPLSSPGRYRLAGCETDGASAAQKLSTREIEILECLTRGEANKLIARKFAIAEATVKVHLKASLRKIPAKNRTQAAIWAHDYLVASNNSTVDPTTGAENETAARCGV